MAQFSGPLSALFSGTWSAGEAVGPVVGMLLVDTIGFPLASTLMAAVSLGFVGFVGLVDLEELRGV